MTYEIDIAGLKRQLPICKVTDDLYIGAFVIFGDPELTTACADGSVAALAACSFVDALK